MNSIYLTNEHNYVESTTQNIIYHGAYELSLISLLFDDCGTTKPQEVFLFTQ